MNTNETKNENTVQKPCSNTSKSGANVDKSRGSGKRMNMSPMMQEYCKTKEEYKDCILFYRLGDFYEMFFDDALLVSKELELTLTGKDCKNVLLCVEFPFMQLIPILTVLLNGDIKLQSANR